MGFPKPIEELIDRLNDLPGIGLKTAERLAYHVLGQPSADALALADAIRVVKETVRRCTVCGHLSQGDECGVCSSGRRDRKRICVVETPGDLVAIEESGAYDGLYHVLGGRLAPLEGTEAEDLNVDKLLERVFNSGVEEVILATNPDLEGDATATYVSERLASAGVKVTRLARGLPSGGSLEYLNRAILSDAFGGRKEI